MSSETSAVATTEVRYRSTDIDRPKQCRHWVRPRSAIYSYLFDYHRNYYDDIIDYLDRRQNGVVSEIPRPQTWAERAFRTYTQRLATENVLRKASEGLDLVRRFHRHIATPDYHRREYAPKRLTMTVY